MLTCIMIFSGFFISLKWRYSKFIFYVQYLLYFTSVFPIYPTLILFILNLINLLNIGLFYMSFTLLVYIHKADQNHIKER